MLPSSGWKAETELDKSVKRLNENDSSLTTLRLGCNSIGDNGAKDIAEALKVNTVLTTLYLGLNSIGDVGAKSIAEALQVNTDLTTLTLGHNSIGDDSAWAIAEALKFNTDLTTLDLDKTEISDDGAWAIAEALKVNTALTTLSLNDNLIGVYGANAIAETLKVNTELTKLYLGNNAIGDDGAKAIAEALKVNSVLTGLNLNQNSIGIDGAKAFAEALKVNTVLTKLSISDNSIGVYGTKAIAETLKVNTVLTELYLGNNAIGVNGARAIAEAIKVNNGLTTLYLSHNLINVNGAKAIAEALKVNTDLTALYLWNDSIGDDGAKAIAEALKVNTVLTEIDLSLNSIHDDGAMAIAEALKVNIVLTELDLWNNSIGIDGTKAIAEALKVNTVLTYLHLNGNLIGVDGANAIVEALMVNTVVTTLSLCRNSIGDDLFYGVQRLINANENCKASAANTVQPILTSKNTAHLLNPTTPTLSNSNPTDSISIVKKTELEKYVERMKENDPTLTVLDLATKSIGDNGSKTIAEALKVNTVLTTLDLFNNSIGDDGATAIAEALKVNTVLTTLDLNNNSISVDGAKSIAEALKINTVLTTIDLSDNLIDDKGVKALAEALKVNAVLTTLGLSYNSIGYKGAKAIAEALKVNTVLTTLTLHETSIDNNLLNEIQKLVDTNKNRTPSEANKIQSNSSTTTNAEHPSSPETPPSSNNLTDPIFIGRSKMKKAMDNVNSRPVELPVEFINSCTNNFDDDLKIGEGAFDAVYKGIENNRYFAVKCILFNIAVEKDLLQEVSKSFKIELEALKRFQHPNIISLYGYHLSSESPSQYLVYEFASKGSLDTFYSSEQSRASLSSEIRLRIMFDIIRAIHCLHTEPSDNFILFHRDIKSANICLQQNYTAKLIGCGLAEFVCVDDSISTSAIPISVRNTSHGGVFGTPGYICPWYSRGNKEFEASCDVYSFGIVMIELVTGCLENDVKRLGQFYDRYISNFDTLELAMPKLEEDVDLLAEEWEDGILSSVCELAIRCIQTNRMKRPKTIELVEEMGQLVSQTHHVGGSPKGSCGARTGTTRLTDSTGICALCAKLSTYVSICKDHFTCQQCFEGHVHMHLGEMTIQCPIIGCDNHFSNTDMYKSQILPSYLYEYHLKKQAENDKWSKLLQGQKEILEQVTCVNSQLSKMTQALANLTAGVDAKCPRIVYIVPSKKQGNTTSNLMTWPRNWTKTEVQIFFVCQHSFDVLQEACITTQVTKQWVTSVAPAIKCAMSLLKAASSAGIVTTGIHFALQSIDDFVTDMIFDPLINELTARTDEFLEGKSLTPDLESDREKLTKIVGASYELIFAKSQKEKNSMWKNHLVPVCDKAGSIIWVKKQYQGDYQ